jgi:hypothetical protein
MAKSLARRDPIPELGPCMRVLPRKWARAVDALFVTNGDATKAIEIAGYEGTRESLRVMAHRIFADDRVRAAVREECLKRIDISEPELYSTTMSILRDVKEKASDRLRAVAMVWDRANPVMTKHKIEVEHHLTDDERDVRHYRALQKFGAAQDAFVARFGPNGIARVEALVLAEEAKRREIEAGTTIDADYEQAADVPATSPAPPPTTRLSLLPPDDPEFDEDLLS